ncbi:molybdenum cofactor biosynthesis protein A [Symmachiella macrocystis]|uniref:Molybdenum cofactor biosynthesis protein A n=1 Tax=Symmachiella macrocystis TaxID=2527985 RepID=A0A5C6BND9_9PLAN|nr:radical SAM protein [Symmachiella macrocystis]TWU12826.1 molybdenum cofactor biosynthesis protein A [Symmachiella macrocystis]
MFERISIELTNKCSKGCSFCYNDSGPGGATLWQADEVVAFVKDCAGHGVKAVSFGGGEPLEFDGIFEILKRLDGVLFRSITTNGLLLDQGQLRPLVNASPDKVHVSLHFPQNRAEVARVVRHVQLLKENGIRTGANLLVAKSQLDAAKRAAESLTAVGLADEEIVYLPMRGFDTPTPEEIASVAASPQFQSMTCLPECGASQRFCSVRWDKTVAWCSYTESRSILNELTYDGLCQAMHGIGLKPCDKSLVELSFDDECRPDIEPSSHFTFYASLSKPVDYPAAHSMDTEWFATDKNGHVAFLNSRQPGAVPKVFIEAFGSQYSFYDFEEHLLDPATGNQVQFNLVDFFEAGPGYFFCIDRFNDPPNMTLEESGFALSSLSKEGHEELPHGKRRMVTGLFNWNEEYFHNTSASSNYGYHQSRIDAICWLKDVSVMERLPSDSMLLPVAGHTVAWVYETPRESMRALYEEGLVLSLLREDFYPSPHRFGFYTYANDDYSGGPYDQRKLPQNPVHIDQLAGKTREVCSHVHFASVDFSQMPRFQPAEYFPCAVTYGKWVDLEGNAHSYD